MSKGLRGPDRGHRTSGAYALAQFRKSTRLAYDNLRWGLCNHAAANVEEAAVQFGAYRAHLEASGPLASRNYDRPARQIRNTLTRLRDEVYLCHCQGEEYRSGKKRGAAMKNRKAPSQEDKVCGGRPRGRAPVYGHEKKLRE